MPEKTPRKKTRKTIEISPEIASPLPDSAALGGDAADLQVAALDTMTAEDIEVAGELEPQGEVEPSVEELEAELSEHLEEMVETLQAENPDYTPPPYTPAGALSLLKGIAGRVTPKPARDLLEKAGDTASGVLGADLLKSDTWKGLWYMANYTAQYQADLLKRRMTGEYTTDPYGFDQEFYDQVKPLLDFLYTRYWRISVRGLENIPDEGAALLAANHSGVLPWDALMIALAVYRESANARLTRTLFANWYPNLPFAALLLTKLGMVVSHPENGKRLLEEGELVLVFPEGDKGPAKPFKERYRLARFGRGGFVQMALETGAPILPVAVVGSEETHPVVARADALGKPLGLPYLPVTTLLPLPSKWGIAFEAPIVTQEYGADAAHDLPLVTQISDEVRAKIQGALYDQLKDRKSIFLG